MSTPAPTPAPRPPLPAPAPQPPRPELAKLAALVGYDLGTRAQEVAHAS